MRHYYYVDSRVRSITHARLRSSSGVLQRLVQLYGIVSQAAIFVLRLNCHPHRLFPTQPVGLSEKLDFFTKNVRESRYIGVSSLRTSWRRI